ncbi:DNA primase family protein [Bacillus toyonensis]|uniref:DNA primase family protein n=1 Tax=Bacillus toyonensis TaxID=155322 RepID=UPI0021758165|nr:phage/plasmid primase, P4 family [Bacillus toyonensis]
MNEFVQEFELKKLDLFNCHSSIKSSIENIDDLFIFSQLVAAARKVENISLKKLLTLLLSEKQVNELDFSVIQTINSDNVKVLTSELYHAVQVSKAIQTGFIYEEKKNKHQFNSNLFAEYFLTRVKVVCDENGLLYAYSKQGVFKLLTDVEMGRLVRILMNEGLEHSWRSSHEKEAIQAIKRECYLKLQMDCMRDYVNLQNGMYSLSTGSLEKHHSDFLSTIQIPIKYDSEADCPKFKQFIKDITCDDMELTTVLQELMGYLLSSEIKCEKAFYFFGRGANGKSVLARIIAILVGEQNVSSIPLSQFSSDFGLEGIIGKTVNIAPENEMQGSQLNTEAFKAIVSGDGMNINLKYRPSITNYKSKCRLLFLGNELPDTNDLTNGYFRRMCIIPFKRTFSESEQNRNLLIELTEELSGIFNWAIEGFKRLSDKGYIFSDSTAIEEELRKYRLSQNPVLNFFESIIVYDTSSKLKRSELYNRFKFWCEQNGIDRIRTRQKFYKELMNVIDSKNLSIVEKRIQGYEYLEGINLKSF